jgi:hypothetical protein
MGHNLARVEALVANQWGLYGFPATRGTLISLQSFPCSENVIEVPPYARRLYVLYESSTGKGVRSTGCLLANTWHLHMGICGVSHSN